MNIPWIAQQGSAAHARGNMAVWRVFLRGLAIELDAKAGPDRSAELLRGAGQQMAALLGLPSVASLEALELEMNAALAEIGWGGVRMTLSEADHCVLIAHLGVPTIGSAGDPPGYWLIPALEGLYQGWMDRQPGSNPSFRVRFHHNEEDVVILHYGQ
ncbi:MAG TPA: cellulose biosynthesis protein BcsD [Rhodopila sp.]|uniref:cellulose biosynthesis protein BcsD n=1 Tax=Rhodopila sp. TaxID=2480087 RepID=UPI002B89A9AD|nr:cellulose biosynthesis protein BcsD [Rhodopila sp.]HVY13835.1 cellulose biosynthesis protein BcsD [Rhodopila sp.]